MDENEIKEEIRLIKEMVEKTKRSTAESGVVLILWGFLIIFGSAVMYVLAHFHKYQWIWINWIIWAAIGWAYSIYYGIRQEKTQKTKTYSQIALQNLGLSCGVAFLLVGFIFPLLKVYSYEIITILVATIGGVLIFMAGTIYEWNLLKWCGLLWWLGALAMIPVPADYRGLCFIPLLILGYLVPGFIFRSKYKNSRVHNDD